MKLKASKIYRQSDGAAPDLARDGCVNILGPFISLREVRSVLLMSTKSKDVNLAVDTKLIRGYEMIFTLKRPSKPAWDDHRLPARKNEVFTKLVEKSAFSVNLNKKATFGKMLSGKKSYESEKKGKFDYCYNREILPFIASRSDHCRADTLKELYSRSPFQSPDGTISFETTNDQTNIYFCTFFKASSIQDRSHNAVDLYFY